jgi:hypothetical protein
MKPPSLLAAVDEGLEVGAGAELGRRRRRHLDDLIGGRVAGRTSGAISLLEDAEPGDGYLVAGIDYRPDRVRLDMLEEAVQVCRAMFTGDDVSFSGTHYRLDHARNLPRPVQAGGPKIMIGGAAGIAAVGQAFGLRGQQRTPTPPVAG